METLLTVWIQFFHKLMKHRFCVCTDLYFLPDSLMSQIWIPYNSRFYSITTTIKKRRITQICTDMSVSLFGSIDEVENLFYDHIRPLYDILPSKHTMIEQTEDGLIRIEDIDSIQMEPISVGQAVDIVYTSFANVMHAGDAVYEYCLTHIPRRVKYQQPDLTELFEDEKNVMAKILRYEKDLDGKCNS